MDKILHVGCLVKEGNVYDVLLALSALKVGSVEVRPVAPVLALPAPPTQGKTEKQRKYLATLAAGPKRVKAIAEETNTSLKAASMMMFFLYRKKLVRRVAKGTYALREAK